MTRYIDVDFLAKFPHWERIVKELECAPIADVQEVVRCKDCKYFLHYRCTADNSESYMCQLHGLCYGEGDYCSYGERRDGDEK